MSVKIRMKRLGAKRQPHYRIVVMDSRQKRDGRTIDEIGYYSPLAAEDKQFKVDESKVTEWVGKGAQITNTVRRLLNKNNITLSK